ncbi:MAG: nicotinate-nucleotide adenylyltransferase [Gammaproteobacteria bacterium]|nr:nicotinate-nucleotide adenylyltransferase [Gammaproteobacteria bacterium]
MLEQAIGIFGGTFDPVHLGHLHLAASAWQMANLKEVRMLACAQSPLRTEPIASTKHRLQMLKLAVTEHAYLIIDDSEIIRGDKSYTFDTLQNLRATFKNTPLCLIMGIDAFCNFYKWYKWQNIFDLAHVIVANRPAANKPQATELILEIKKRQVFTAKNLEHELAGRILFIEINPLPISATQIRWLIKNGQSASNLLPDKVWQYIQNNNLYK